MSSRHNSLCKLIHCWCCISLPLVTTNISSHSFQIFQITFKNFLRRDLFRSYFSIRPVVPYLKIFYEASKKAINNHGSFKGPLHRIQLSRARLPSRFQARHERTVRGEQCASRSMSKEVGDAGDLAARAAACGPRPQFLIPIHT